MAAALLIIDMLRDFVEVGGALYIGPAAEEVKPRVQAALRAARAEGRPVIYVCDRHRPDDAEFAMFPPHCVEGTPGAEVVPELAPVPGEIIIPKRRYSGFFGTDLDTTLREREVHELWLCGVCTNICVLYTAAEARMRGYRVVVLREAVGSFSEAAHRFALEEMEKTLGCQLR
ncbi:MAG: cysteine hydrolase family protein [Moorellales bacterium]